MKANESLIVHVPFIMAVLCLAKKSTQGTITAQTHLIRSHSSSYLMTLSKTRDNNYLAGRISITQSALLPPLPHLLKIGHSI